MKSKQIAALASRMGRIAVAVAAAALTTIGGVSAQQPARNLADQVEASGGRVIITLKGPPGAALKAPGAPVYSKAEMTEAVDGLEQRRSMVARGSANMIGAVFATVSPSQLAQIASDPEVASVEADVAMPLMEASPGRLGEVLARARRANVPWGIDRVTAPETWAMPGGNRGAGIKVAVLDSGGDRDHPDLVYAGGYNAMTGSTSPSAWDDSQANCNGHGTHIAGTIAGKGVGSGVIGVAPDVQLYAIKVFENIDNACQAWVSSQIAGLNWAVDHGIRLVNVSIGGSYYGAYDAALWQAGQAGTYVFGAAGNNFSYVAFPGSSDYAFAVAALTSSNTKAGYSTSGPQVDFAAPGSGIYSTMPGGGYGNKSGTSMATPHAVGVAALVLADNPSLSFEGLRTALKNGALDVGASGFDNETGWGLVRAYNSLGGGGEPPPPVPLTLAVSPGSRSATVQAGSNAPASTATVTLAGDNSSSTNWTATKRKSWTSLTTASGTGSGTVRWNRNTSGLAPGTYVDTITVTASGAGGSPTRVIDVITVTPAPVPLTLAVLPGSRSATVQAGSNAPSTTATVTLAGDNSSSTNWTATKRKSWTSLTTASGTGSGTVRWNRNTSGLAPGTYVDTITVTASGAGGSPDRVIDTVVVTAAPVPLTLAVSPGSRSATVQQGSNASSTTATVTLAGDNSSSTNWTATKRKSWTSLTTSSGTGSGTVRWNRNTSSLAPGTYVDTITVTASGAGGSPDRVIDTIVVTAAPVPLTLAVSPGSRSATVQQGSNASSTTATVTLAGDNSSSTGWTATKRKSWTSLTTASGTGSGTVRWNRNTSSLAPGTYVDTITVTASGAGGSPDRVIDTVVVAAAPVPLTLAVSPGSRSATVQQGNNAPASTATVTLAGDNSSSTGWTATKRRSWTSLSTSSGTGSGTVRWNRNTSGLAPGTYVDTITVTASGAGGSPDRVIDTVVVTPAPVPLTLAVSPGSRSATVQQGNNAPSTTATVTLAGDNSGSTGWTATKRKSWTSLTTTSGTGSGTVRWNRNTSSLAPGTYVDTITVTASGAGGSPDRVIDTVVVTPAPVPLTLAVAPGSRHAEVVQGSSAPSASADVVLDGNGAATTDWTASRGRSWTSLTTASGTGSGTVRWSRNSAGLAPGTYVDTITVVASGATGSPARVIDSLVVTAAPVPLTIAVSPGSRSASVEQGISAPSATATVILAGDAAASTHWTVGKRRSWTALITSSGTGSGTLQWSRNSAGLSPGTYVDTITVTANSGASPSARVIDSLVITPAPAPTAAVALARRGARRRALLMSGRLDGAVTDSVQVQSITGAGSTGWTATENSSWLTLETNSGQAPGWLRWRRSLGALSVGSHVDSIMVSSVADPSVHAFYHDTVDVVQVPVPQVTIAVRSLFRSGGGLLTTDQRLALDAGGNHNGRFDLGDFLAWVRQHNLRLSTSEMAELRQAVLLAPEPIEKPRARSLERDRN